MNTNTLDSKIEKNIIKYDLFKTLSTINFQLNKLNYKIQTYQTR